MTTNVGGAGGGAGAAGGAGGAGGSGDAPPLDRLATVELAADGDDLVATVLTDAPSVDLGGGDVADGSTLVRSYVARFDSAGLHLWSKGASFHGAGTSSAFTPAVDPASGDIVLAGSFDGVLDFGSGPLNSTERDPFVARLSSSGAEVWSQVFPLAGNQPNGQPRVSPTGDIVLFGLHDGGAVQFGGPVLSGKSMFLASFDSEGTHLWSQEYGDPGITQFPMGHAIAADGSILVTGSLGGSLDFGTGPISSVDVNDIFLARVSATGSGIWARQLGGNGPQFGFNVAAVDDGDVVTCGQATTGSDLGDGPVTLATASAYLARYDASGAHRWSITPTLTGSSLADCAVDAQGHSFAVGDFGGTIDWGGGTLTASSSRSLYVAKVGASGEHIWNSTIGDSKNFFYPTSIVVNASGHLVVATYLYDVIDLGGGPVGEPDSWRTVIFALDAEGQHLWSKSLL